MKKSILFIIFSLVGYFTTYYIVRCLLGGFPFFSGDTSDELGIHVGLIVVYIGICTRLIIHEIQKLKN